MNSQIKKINLNHSFIFFLFCNIFSLVALKINGFTISPLICLFLILSIGISHGSLDNVKGKKLFRILEINNFFIFYLTYILIALMVIILWIFIPYVSLIIFLGVASYHFGKEDTQFLIVDNSYYNQFLDKIFLRVLEKHPEKMSDIFFKMFKASPKTVIKFLSNKSNFLEDLSIILRMPKLTFIKALFY